MEHARGQGHDMGGAQLGREGRARLGQRRGVYVGGGTARAEARRVRWNESRGEGRGLEDERSGFFERDGIEPVLRRSSHVRTKS